MDKITHLYIKHGGIKGGRAVFYYANYQQRAGPLNKDSGLMWARRQRVKLSLRANLARSPVRAAKA